MVYASCNTGRLASQVPKTITRPDSKRKRRPLASPIHPQLLATPPRFNFFEDSRHRRERIRVGVFEMAHKCRAALDRHSAMEAEQLPLIPPCLQTVVRRTKLAKPILNGKKSVVRRRVGSPLRTKRSVRKNFGLAPAWNARRNAIGRAPTEQGGGRCSSLPPHLEPRCHARRTPLRDGRRLTTPGQERLNPLGQSCAPQGHRRKDDQAAHHHQDSEHERRRILARHRNVSLSSHCPVAVGGQS